MSDRNAALSAVRPFLTNPSEANAEALRPHLVNDLVMAVHTTNENGAEAAIKAMQESLFQNVVYGGQWEEPQTEGAVTTQVLTMPVKAIAAACKFRFTVGTGSRIEKIEGEWILPPNKLEPEPVMLTAAMRARIDKAEEDLMPILFACVTPEGRPQQVYRNTAHTRGDDQLAFWNPRPSGTFLETITNNPDVSAIYRHAGTHEMLEMSGRARVVEAEREAREIYDARAETARRSDPDGKGVAVVIDLDRVTGLIHSAETGAIERILMVRNGAG